MYTPDPSPIPVKDTWMKTYDKVKAKVSSIDLLFPGHDMKMLTKYPTVAEDITRLV